MHCGDLKGKEIRKGRDICMCVADSFCCTVETNTTLESNYTPIDINIRKRERNMMPPKRINATNERWACWVYLRPAVGSGGHKQLACC